MSIFYIIAENRKNVHSSSTHLVLEMPSNLNEDEYEKSIKSKNYKIIDKMNNFEEAEKLMNKYTLNNKKEYTKLLNLNGVPSIKDLDMINCRWCFVYIDESFTVLPGIYDMSIYNFIVLKKHFNTIRLADNIEIENCDRQESTIPVSQEMLNTIKILGLESKLPNTFFVTADNQQALDGINEIQKLLEKTISCILSTSNENTKNGAISDLCYLLGLDETDTNKYKMLLYLEDIKNKKETMNSTDIFKYVMSTFDIDKSDVIDTDIDLPD